MRAIDADTDSNMNAASAIDASFNGRNGIKITVCHAKQRSMAADGTRSPFVGHRRGETTDDGKNRRGETVIRKIQFLHNNVVFFLVPLLLMILKETSALPPIIKIGKWPIFFFAFSPLISFRNSRESITHIRLCEHAEQFPFSHSPRLRCPYMLLLIAPLRRIAQPEGRHRRRPINIHTY